MTEWPAESVCITLSSEETGCASEGPAGTAYQPRGPSTAASAQPCNFSWLLWQLLLGLILTRFERGWSSGVDSRMLLPSACRLCDSPAHQQMDIGAPVQGSAARNDQFAAARAGPRAWTTERGPG